MKILRNIVRPFACVLMLVILGIAGYNIAIRYNYPVKYTEFIEKYSEEYDVDAHLVLAVIRCESSFETQASSSAGAKGLMQLTEETFYDVRRMVKDSEIITFESHCFDPEINIKYGTKYLQYLTKIYDGDIIAVLAAYNAGMGNVNDWLGNDKTLKAEKILFTETKDYVDKVLKAERHYKDLYNPKGK